MHPLGPLFWPDIHIFQKLAKSVPYSAPKKLHPLPTIKVNALCPLPALEAIPFPSYQGGPWRSFYWPDTQIPYQLAVCINLAPYWPNTHILSQLASCAQCAPFTNLIPIYFTNYQALLGPPCWPDNQILYQLVSYCRSTVPHLLVRYPYLLPTTKENPFGPLYWHDIHMSPTSTLYLLGSCY